MRAVVLGLLATACGASEAGTAGNGSERTAVKSTSVERVPDWTTKGCAAPEVAREVLGHSAAMLLRSYGAAASDARFTLGTGVTPDRQILLNVLPMRGNDARVVRELVWVKGGCRLTIWLTARGRDWVAVQSLRASATSES